MNPQASAVAKGFRLRQCFDETSWRDKGLEDKRDYIEIIPGFRRSPRPADVKMLLNFSSSLNPFADSPLCFRVLYSSKVSIAPLRRLLSVLVLWPLSLNITAILAVCGESIRAKKAASENSAFSETLSSRNCHNCLKALAQE